MIDWTKSMIQTYEFYEVDPYSWRDKKRITTILDCTVIKDLGSDTLGSASMTINEEFKECYVRVYMKVLQNGISDRIPLGTYLVQSPGYSFDGFVIKHSADAYTPLIELKEKPVPLGYTIYKDGNIMNYAYSLTRENLRAPVVKNNGDKTLINDFISASDDTWLTFISDLLTTNDYRYSLDEYGRVLFEPLQDAAAIQPKFTFDDSNSSILYPELTIDGDLFGIPNVVEVVCSTSIGTFYSRVVNDNPDSPISTVNRGREIVLRDIEPSIIGLPSQQQVNDYANNLLKSKSTVSKTISYSHGYYPVTIGDCVRLNYKKAGLTDVKAIITSQSISCKPGCQVSETAIYTTNLWR